MSLKLVVLAICVVLARADIDAAFYELGDGFLTNSTVDGDDSLVHLEGDLASFEPLGFSFADSKATFEVLGCGGVCQNTNTKCSSGYKSGLCPGPSNIKCCPMSTSSCSGQCQDTSLSCGSGYQTGKCPGANNIKCCPSGGGGGGGGGTPPAGTPAQRQGLYTAAMAIYNQRASEHYTQGPSRWSGITDHIHPPNAPPYSDCSSAVTWCYWNVFGSGPDFLNGQNWAAGYTGSMSGRGKSVACSAMQIGDLAFYGRPTISHVAISVGNGKVVSHGSDPAGLYSVNYRSDLNQCRTYLS